MGRIAGVTAEQTRDRLLEAAAAVFASKGYEGATIAEIAERAGLSSGAIYAHYQSKAELLTEAIRGRSGDELAALLAAEETGSILDVLARQGAELQRRSLTGANDRSKNRGSVLIEAIVSAGRDPDVGHALADQVRARQALFVELLRHGQRSGDVDTALSPEAIARFSLMVGLGALLVGSIDLEPIDEREWTALIDALVGRMRDRDPRATDASTRKSNGGTQAKGKTQ